jgi:hypothetical protein
MSTIEIVLDPAKIASSERIFIIVASLFLLFHAGLCVGDRVSYSSSQSIAPASANLPSPSRSVADDIAAPARVDPVNPAQVASPSQGGQGTGIVSDDRARRLARKKQNESPVSADDQNAIAAPSISRLRAQPLP